MASRAGRYRSVGLLAACVALFGCDDGDRVAARVGEWSLTEERLADLLVLAQPLPLDSLTVAGLVDHWVSMAAVGQRVAAGTDLTTPEATDLALWLENREAILDAERRDRLGRQVSVTRAEAEAVFRGDTLMLLAHVLRRVDASTSPAEKDLQLRTAEEILESLIAGGGWDAAVARSEDEETARSSGLLGLLHLNSLPLTLRAAAQVLQPGQVSSVLEGPEGFHILHRPRFEDVSVLYQQMLSQRLLDQASVEADRAFLTALDLTLTAGAEASVRGWAGGDPPPRGDEAIVTWSDGELGVQVASRYVAALRQDARARLATAEDADVAELLRELALREARMQAALARGVRADSGSVAQLNRLHEEDVASWTQSLSGEGDGYTAQGLDRYMESLVARRTALRPVSPLLRAWLLEPLDWSVDRDVLRTATASATDLIASGPAPQ